MKVNAFVCALAALATGASGFAVAQPRDYRDYRNDHREQRGEPDRHGRGDWRGGPERRGPPPRFEERRGAGPDHDFYRGSRLPPQYRSRQYVVDDWRRHHLAPPPRGYHWVQVGVDYVLVAIATGIIAQILLNQ